MDEDVSPHIRLEATVHGRVQGVGFRVSAAGEARRLGLVGTVTNMGDGTVRVTAEGPRHGIDPLVAWLRRGPSLARVDRVDCVWGEPSGEWTAFEIT